MKRLTIRLNNKAKKALEKYKLIFNIHNKKISYNKIINILIYFKLPEIKIDQKYINYFLTYKKRADNLHSKDFYQDYTKELANLTNAINQLTRQFNGIATNINQITHIANLKGVDDIEITQQLKQYRNNINTIITFCALLSRKVSLLWKM